MTYWSVFKNEYKKIIFWAFCFSVAWLFPSWCAGKPISIGVLISTLVGFLGGLLIMSYAIHVGWVTEVICPEEQLVLQKIGHLTSRYKHKLISVEWFILRTVLEAIAVSCFLMYFIGLTDDRLMDVLKFLAMVVSATATGLTIKYCQKNGYL